MKSLLAAILLSTLFAANASAESPSVVSPATDVSAQSAYGNRVHVTWYSRSKGNIHNRYASRAKVHDRWRSRAKAHSRWESRAKVHDRYRSRVKIHDRYRSRAKVHSRYDSRRRY